MGTRSTSSPSTLLCIDDDPEIRRLFLILLKRRYPGNRVLATGDGSRAVSFIGRHPVDLLLLDLFMPRLDGFTILQRMAEKRIVVVVSAASPKETEVQERLTRLGVLHFIPKPVDLSDLFRAIDDVLLRQGGARGEPAAPPPLKV